MTSLAAGFPRNFLFLLKCSHRAFSRRSFTSIAHDTRVTVAILSRDVLSQALTGAVGANCMPRAAPAAVKYKPPSAGRPPPPLFFVSVF